MHSDSKNEFWTALFEKVGVSNFLITCYLFRTIFFNMEKAAISQEILLFSALKLLICTPIDFFISLLVFC